MKTNSLKLIALTIGVPTILISCAGPAYVQTAPPPPPVYTQAPPPPPPVQQPAQQETYVDPNYSQPQQDNPPPPTITYQTYYTELSPYGQWVYTAEYGNVWVPAAGPEFQPYGSCGHWVLTNYGWTWVSDYSWGWATFHYGRWEFDGLMGWYWIPGYEWSPAWVSWRSTPGYYGWAPLGPTYVNGGYATYNCPPERYVFVNATYINSPNMSTYYEPRNQNATYYTRSTVVTNTYADNDAHTNYYAGPPRQEVERYTGAPIHPANVVSASSPEKAGANGSQVTVFRPAVHQPSPSDAVQPAPPKVYQKTEIAPLAQRQVLTKPNQPRVEPFKPENVRPANPEPNKSQPEQQKPPVQQQQQQKPPVQQQQPQPQQQRPPMQQPQPQQQPQQQKPPVQQPQPQQQRPPVQQPQQQHPAQQQPRPQQPKQQPKQKPQQPKKQSQPSKQQANQPEKKQ